VCVAILQPFLLRDSANSKFANLKVFFWRCNILACLKKSIYCIPTIRQHIWFTGTSFFGYEDVGDGPGKNPAKHVMMIMVTALNMSWKLPVAYFLLPDSFPSQKRAELLRVCLYKLNCTGAIITNLVMDNCPGGYNDFLKCTLFTKN
jgi:hypothetical protein